MLIRIHDLPLDGRGIREEVDAGWVDQALGDVGRGVAGSVGVFEARVERIADTPQVIVQGRGAVDVRLACARCGEDFDAGLEFEIVHVLAPRPASEGEVEGDGEADDDDDGFELSDDDMDVSYYDGNEFDMAEVVREHLLLALPMNPLCAEACAGLCGQCGADLNEAACGCEEPVDPRLAALADIKIN